jgi:hypothetical protein
LEGGRQRSERIAHGLGIAHGSPTGWIILRGARRVLSRNLGFLRSLLALKIRNPVRGVWVQFPPSAQRKRRSIASVSRKNFCSMRDVHPLLLLLAARVLDD